MNDHNEGGMALISTVLILALLGALLIGFVEILTSDQKSGGAARDQTQAYVAAHAGMEKLTSDLGTLFAANYAPSCDQIDALVADGKAPTLPGITFAAPGGGSGYTISYTCEDGKPVQVDSDTISSGKYLGFQGLITRYNITVTARTTSGAEVRMRREMQTVAIPVFQFGMFSENDLSFFAGPNFNFGGRVHTNGNLFVAEGDGKTLTLSDRVTVFGEVIRKNLSNGWLTESGGYNGTVLVAKSSSKTTSMGLDKGSWGAATPQLPGEPTGVALLPLNDPAWTTFSVTTTNGYMTNARTGATRLDLPLAQMGATPVDLIRRPEINSNENTANAAVFGQRYFAMASLRILLSDTAADITSLPTVTSDAPVDLTNLAASGYAVTATTPPIARAPDTTALATAGNYLTPVNTPLVGGFLKIEMQKADGSWDDVTTDILNLGIAGKNVSTGVLNTPGTACTEPNSTAILRLQRLRDNPASGTLPCGNGSLLSTDYWPNVLYDPREGLYRDNSSLTTEHRHFLGGVMHYVELDVANLSKWMADQGSDIMQETGYVVYFSDRRGNWHDTANDSKETGEYGFEDVVNPTLSAGYPGNGAYSNPPSYNSGATPETGEDFNADGELQTYGAIPFQAFGAPLDSSARPWTLLKYNYSGSGGDYVLTKPIAARVNPPILFRRALKLVNGAKGNIISPGLTVVAENPLYVQGNYNADSGGFGATGDGHVACAMIADAVTLLSNQWNDINSFLSAHDPSGGNLGSASKSPGRVASGDVWFRFGVVAGKGLSFSRPTGYTTYQDFGTDGGAHNFLRYLEDLDSITVNYRGSIVSFYNSRQANGTYKCCNNVYKAPGRGYNFDTEFLTPSLLPPRTPMFRDVNVLTFRQILRATQ